MLVEDVVKAGGMVWHGKPVDPETGEKTGRGVAPYKGESSLKANDIKGEENYYIISQGFIGQGKLVGLPNEDGTATNTNGAFLYRSTSKNPVKNKVVELVNGEEVRFRTNGVFRVSGSMLLSNATLQDVDVKNDDINETDGVKSILNMLLKGTKVNNDQLKRLLNADEFTMTNTDLLRLVQNNNNELETRIQILEPSNEGERILSTLVLVGHTSKELEQFKFDSKVKSFLDEYLDKFVAVYNQFN